MEQIIKENNLLRDPKEFPIIADKILNGTILECKGKKFRIREIEFYLKNDKHSDIYCHQNKDQKSFGYWYFHRTSDSGGYKSGTYKGLDITLGDENSFYGILIRTIQGEDNKMIEGPCKSVNKLLETCGFEPYGEGSLDKLTGKILRPCIGWDISLKDFSLKKETIRKGPRIGLSNKYPLWRDLPYRFAIDGIKNKAETLF